MPVSARVLFMLGELWIPAVWLGVTLPLLGDAYADSGLLAELRASVDVPAQVVSTHPVHEYHGKYSSWDGFRVTARFQHGGTTWLATGDMGRVPSDGAVRARVPLSRPDLAVAFVGDRPHHNTRWISWAFLSAVAFGLIGLMLVRSARQLRSVRAGRLARGRHVSRRTHKSRHHLQIRYGTSHGEIESELNLSARQASRVLADPAPVVAYGEVKPYEAFALAAVAGLRWDEVAGQIAPAPWWRVVWASLPVLIILGAAVLALKFSYQVDLYAELSAALTR